MSLEWSNLRSWNASQRLAFEEICCQLAHAKQPASKATFYRKGPGADAGVECYWKLENGDELAWQAKFFPSPDPVRWTQIDESIKTALEKHPRLIRYTVCLPRDRSDRRDGNTIQAQWNDHVEKWTEWANERGMTIEFNYWGEHEIFMRLSQREHHGRHYFWFNEHLLDQAWLAERVQQANQHAKDSLRYMPSLNIELPIQDLFYGIGRTEEYFVELWSLQRELRDSTRYARGHPDFIVGWQNISTQLDTFHEILSHIDVETSRLDDIDMDMPTQCLNNIVQDIEGLVQSVRERLDDNQVLEDDGRRELTDFESELLCIKRECQQLSGFLTNKKSRLVNNPGDYSGLKS